MISLRNELATWVNQFIDQITKEWDWPVTFSIDAPEKYQKSYQIFLSLKKLQLSVVVLFDVETTKERDFAELKDKINSGLIRLKELAEQRVIT
ncbi:MAG: hypothetical protein ACFFD8_06430 [Candidatus Thorarchaeota archaeon]